MISNKAVIDQAIAKFKDMHLLVVGDVILDRYVWGGADRISPEAPVPIVNVKRVEDRAGGAGNVVHNLVNIGVNVSLCGFIGEDDEGQSLAHGFDKIGVNRDGIIVTAERPTSLKTRVIAQAQQVVRIDREDINPPSDAACEGLAAVIESKLDQVDAIIVSDYGKGCITEPVLRVLSEAHRSGKISISKKPMMLDPRPFNFQFYDNYSFNVVTPNRKEAEHATGIAITNEQSAIKAAQILEKKWNTDLAIITLGEDGMLLYPKDGKSILLETKALEVYDVSGAGDTVASVFTAALATGVGHVAAGEIANLAAGVVVGEVGTVPIQLNQLIERINSVFT